MLKKEITFVDFDGNKQTETHYFNLTKAEMIEFDASYPGGAFQRLSMMVKEPTKYMGEIVAAFKDLIMRSYGERTLDGKFIKSQQMREAFGASEAYSELFMEITANEEAAAAFIAGISPKVEGAQVAEIVQPAAFG